MYSPKIAIIIPTILRDDLLMKVLNSIVEVWSDDWKVFVIDQNPIESDSEEKRIFYETASSCFHHQNEQRIEVIRVPFNSGISYCRNLGVEFAYKQGIPYTIISADSIEFTESIKVLDCVITLLEVGKFDLIGLDLKNRFPWEGKLNLIEGQHFEIEFLPEERKPGTFYYCDIVKNYFITKTDILYYVKWDENLKAQEHEDFFIRLKMSDYKVAWSDFGTANYIGEKSKIMNDDYARLRRINMNNGRKYLLEKWKITQWVKYKK